MCIQPIDAWEQCNHTRKTELNRYLVHALENSNIAAETESASGQIRLYSYLLYTVARFTLLGAFPNIPRVASGHIYVHINLGVVARSSNS